MSLVRDKYKDLVADCENNLDTVTYAAEKMPKRRGPSYVHRLDRLKDALEWYHISVEKLVAFQREQQNDPQLDSYDFEHLTSLCVSHRNELHNMQGRLHGLL